MPAYYRATLYDFLADDPKKVLGILTASNGDSGFAELKHRQTKAWQREIEILRVVTGSLVAETPERGQWTLAIFAMR